MDFFPIGRTEGEMKKKTVIIRAKRIPNIPPKNTLYYGLTPEEWMDMFRAQGSCCAICKQGDKQMTTDHQHVKGWKKMVPEERKKYVRGILCVWDNFRVLRRGITLAKLKNAVTYLESYENRKKGVKE